MNGGHDLGGMMGFGPVLPEENEPVFHGKWEARVLALTLAMGATGMWNIDKSRHARETTSPANYLNWSYYRIWLEGLEKLLVNSGLVSIEEIRTANPINPPATINNKLLVANVENVLAKGGPASRPSQSKAVFAVGDNVGTSNIHSKNHTRLAGYLRARKGSIVHVHGPHVFPDTNAQGNGENPKWLYTVKFSARELWGEAGAENDFVFADLFEPYLVARA